jgi:hypothetical protein
MNKIYILVREYAYEGDQVIGAYKRRLVAQTVKERLEDEMEEYEHECIRYRIIEQELVE